MTGKPEKLYFHALHDLKGIIKEEDLSDPKPSIVMTDFEKGLQNVIKRVFNLSNDQISGCYFHYVKALITKAKKLGLLPQKKENKEVKLLIRLLKLLVHCPAQTRKKFFEELEGIFEDKGERFEQFLAYYKINWLNSRFLDGLFDAYQKGDDVILTRTNNTCELFNRYLGKITFSDIL